ncbi:MAG: hypothetical protein DMG11_15580 [Acidobacteria bacterium]|nr:MAG: hypothetical protein DMG11_15580 [Acidobacteriota bacterium]
MRRYSKSPTRFPAVTESLKRTGIKSCCYLPLTTPLRRLGAMAFGSRGASKFEGDILFLQRVANQVAVAIDNALHFDQVQQYQLQLRQESDRLRILLEINNAIASRLEMREFIEAVSNSLRGILQHELIALSSMNRNSSVSGCMH